MTWTAKEICLALTATHRKFDRRRWIVVPNVSWGWGLDYEADLVAIAPKSGRAQEIEIKISAADIRADSRKAKFRAPPDPRISRFWYAVPEDLVEVALTSVDAGAGVLSVSRINEDDVGRSRVIRQATKRTARPCTADEIHKILHLGVMRYWDLRLAEPEVTQ